MRVWITRTRPGADQTATRLGALGVDSLIDPVLEVRALGFEIDTSDFETLAFTSPNGVAVFAGRCATRDLPAFAVGEATAAALRQAGFERVEAAEGDLESLARLLEARRPGRILALAPTEPAGDLAALAARSIAVAPFPDDASLARLAVDTLSDAQP